MMKRMQSKRIGALILVMCLVMSLFAGCRTNTGTKDPGNGPTKDTGITKDTATYTVTVQTAAGTALKEIGVYIYEDDTCQELVAFEKTDAEGKITFTAPKLSSYVAVLKDVPAGYTLEKAYPVTDSTSITLPIELLGTEDLENLRLGLGDVMADFRFTDIQGNTYQLSQLLQQKEAVVLNFWYLTCTPCRSEFPYLQKAYGEYSDKIEVLALNPVNVDADSAEAIREYAQELELTFPMVQCNPQWEKVMNIKGYPTTVVIDRYGVITLIHTGGMTCTENFTDIFASFTGEDYRQQIVADAGKLMVTPPSEEPIENPESVSGVDSFQLTVRPGETVYCDLYRMENTYLQVKTTDAYVIYKGTNYQPKNGVIGLTVNTPDTRTPVQIGICNQSNQTVTYEFTLSAAYGSLNNPIAMTLGQFNTTIYAGNDEGMYYRYVAQEDGYLRLRCLDATVGVPYDYVLYNLNTYANRSLEADGKTDDQGKYLSIPVSKGDVIQFSASTLPNDSGSYPAGSFLFQADMMDPSQVEEDAAAEKLVYAITVTNEKREPISGVQVSITGTATVGETTKQVRENLTTNEKGVAAVKTYKGTYKATVKVPTGYQAKTTEFTLTEQTPTLAVKFDTLVDTTTTYTVKVVDENGTPMANVVVMVDNMSATTDDTGIASVRLPAGTYTAVVSVPQGYKSEQSAYEFAEATELTVKLLKDADTPGTDSVMYAVTVLDYSGAAVTGIPVTFRNESAPVGMGITDAGGRAQLSLPKGEYTVQLPGNYHCEDLNVLLTQDQPEAVLTVIPVVNTANKAQLYVGDAYYVEAGQTYLPNMQDNVTNYFIFQPSQTGVYRISSTAGTVSYWGATDAYITDQTTTTDFDGNAYTREYRQDQVGNTICIIGVTGTAEATLLITRMGDVELTDEEKAEWIIFAGTETPAAGTKYVPTQTGTLTFVDVTGTTAANTPVKGDDGLYHLGSKTGPVLYVKLGPTGYRHVSFYNMMGNEQGGGARFSAVFYENGKFVKKEMYNDCLKAYTQAVDAEGLGLYPLNDDLIYMLKNGGAQMGWWDSTNPNYLFSAAQGLNTELAWMFNVCYFE